MEKIAINLNRLKWCCDTLGIDIHNLHTEIKIAKSSIKKAINGEPVFSIKQLGTIAKYFNQNLLFFLEPGNVIEEKIYSPQFRTINNQKPIKNKKLLNFIKNAEKQRKVYLNLLDDLQIPIINNWKTDLNINKENIKQSSQIVREWLEIKLADDFQSLRNAVEAKGIMVIVSNGYNGSWQIDKKDLTRGFCLNYAILPIIVIKKQESKGAQAFTLIHELAHLLLHKESMIDEEEDFYNYQGKEREANEFASNVLIPDEYLNNINLNELGSLEIQEHDNFLQEFKKNWCVSGDAILYRLFLEKRINNVHYQAYKNFKEQKRQEFIKEQLRNKELGIKPKSIPRMFRHKEPINIFGRNYVATVLDAKQNKHITLAKASVYLDNLKIHSLHKLEKDFV
jgi:Zn-dependent peptidase ImmA (M78 family)